MTKVQREPVNTLLKVATLKFEKRSNYSNKERQRIMCVNGQTYADSCMVNMEAQRKQMCRRFFPVSLWRCLRPGLFERRLESSLWNAKSIDFSLLIFFLPPPPLLPASFESRKTCFCWDLEKESAGGSWFLPRG